MEHLILLFMGAFVVWREYVHYREVQDLLNRLMSRDYIEYKQDSRPMPRIRNIVLANMKKHSGEDGE